MKIYNFAIFFYSFFFIFSLATFGHWLYVYHNPADIESYYLLWSWVHGFACGGGLYFAFREACIWIGMRKKLKRINLLYPLDYKIKK